MTEPTKALPELPQSFMRAPDIQTWGACDVYTADQMRAYALRALASSEQGEVHVFNCGRCPVSVASRWLEPECPECGDPCQLDETAKPALGAAKRIERATAAEARIVELEWDVALLTDAVFGNDAMRVMKVALADAEAVADRRLAALDRLVAAANNLIRDLEPHGLTLLRLRRAVDDAMKSEAKAADAKGETT